MQVKQKYTGWTPKEHGAATLPMPASTGKHEVFLKTHSTLSKIFIPGLLCKIAK